MFSTIINRLKPVLSRKSTKCIAPIVIVVILLIVFTVGKDEQTDTTPLKKTVVEVTTPAQYAGEKSLSTIGNVRAFTEADITSEKSGRVVRVNVTLGQTVTAGTVLATLENSAEAASVLQAEGVYDSAVALAEQSKLGIGEADTTVISARNSAITAMQNAYNTTNGIVVSNIDYFFSQPNATLPGLKIGGKGYTQTLNSERVAYQTLLPSWKSSLDSITDQSSLETKLELSIKNVRRTIDIVDIFIFIFDQREEDQGEFAGKEAEFIALKATLNGVLAELDSARSRVKTASDAKERAAVTASGGGASTADAQVKQALGSLRAAQSNYAKTVLRTPISGTVNSIGIKAGDFINAFTKVAVVANNNALEIITYVSDAERDLLMVGDIVQIEDQFEGTVTNISPAVDSLTKKTEVRIATENTNIANGDTVRITKKDTGQIFTTDQIKVPLTAVKFDRENGSIFTVADGKLVANPVILGKIFGDSVEVVEGLKITDEFVVDARGLIVGEEVAVTN